ncbi:haloacid dehalogenase type II [Teichococcus oryzae]|uniref:Haloacid dehalogenase type II n=1 Tax=Teichococcus oryzae TaxID=1608942 RepID=A0A5B2TI54_9PROT|nr:haloacid dehalogenase type II [Pseudoroseomonas oryzae]KAA2213869.1 haloacid dehalogenase type II [Pseudoroseomonas oryzae]
MRLHDFRVLSFDCYGTLIDWESGIHEALQPLLMRGGLDLPQDAVLEAFAQHESAQQAETPGMPYAELLARVHARLADEWGVEPDARLDARFGASVPDWPAFPDSAEALAYLGQHYTLVVLSNVDRRSFAASQKRLGIAFHAVYTAEEIGSYKPDRRNFDFMLARLAEQGHGRADILHTAQSLFHDHAPAKKAGLASAWIDRREGQEGWGATVPPPSGTGYEFRFPSLIAMARAHRQEAMA